MSSTSVYLPDPLIRRLDDVARREDRSRSYVVTRVLEAYLEREQPRESSAVHPDSPFASGHLAAGV